MNLEIFYKLFSLAHQSVPMDTALIFIATGFGYFVLALSLIFITFHKEAGLSAISSLSLFRRRVKEIFVYSAAIIFSWVAVQELKVLFGKDRPFEILDIVPLLTSASESFPSGHAAIFGALATILLVFHRKAETIILAFLALLVPIARIAVGLHFPRDILAGLFVGMVFALLFSLLLRKSLPKLNK